MNDEPKEPDKKDDGLPDFSDEGLQPIPLAELTPVDDREDVAAFLRRSRVEAILDEFPRMTVDERRDFLAQLISSAHSDSEPHGSGVAALVDLALMTGTEQWEFVEALSMIQPDSKSPALNYLRDAVAGADARNDDPASALYTELLNLDEKGQWAFIDKARITVGTTANGEPLPALDWLKEAISIHFNLFNSEHYRLHAWGGIEVIISLYRKLRAGVH